ncbi:hypothetical protein DIU31_009175 [Mucilaginibacter rubeus]|uniref:Uncharacterized protein n=1 Tax=Mucilaginibacter rubeus TaxID=2027860 RepID=A0AAE6JF63_9SPHI|nr:MULTISPECIES: hypothetical protein [Mucilaginibacter]QEM03677.1 hypothetical protein DIU31_009175 [Mucilaginibacter rubeus]QEM16288.1 hypothetical protein DIU38_009270 [Mucilaginibacter gossypii]QTE40950.1 hypothetical protein J3L19_18495 [Mucilaginibacter rubeus]QTE47553.1 hypothetical protein J3L21_18470 [Mucilaginibacter rubeus]QTE58945.1 hypothetical protein J3L23_10135 [Mucilaginibacter rubeus]
MNELHELSSAGPGISISQILKYAGFRQVETCGRIVIYENWSQLAGASIKIACDDQLEVWYDQHYKKGGTLVDLVKHWWHVDEQAANHKIALLQQDATKVKRPRIQVPVKIPNYVIEDIKDLGTNDLITNFLNQNGLFETARQSFKELYYYTVDFYGNKKDFCAAACQNSKYGWQVISKHFNGCIGKVGITILKNDLRRLVVFENQFRYLIWKKENSSVNHSAVILNTNEGLNEAIRMATSFPEIGLYFSATAVGVEAANNFARALPYANNHLVY